MPRKPWKTIKKLREDLTLTSWRENHLVEGHILISLVAGLDGREDKYPFWSEDHRRALWERHKGAIMQKRRFEFFGRSELEEGSFPAAFYEYRHDLIYGEDFDFDRHQSETKDHWIYSFKPLTAKARRVAPKKRS